MDKKMQFNNRDKYLIKYQGDKMLVKSYDEFLSVFVDDYYIEDINEKEEVLNGIIQIVAIVKNTEFSENIAKKHLVCIEDIEKVITVINELNIATVLKVCS
ncbi:MAG: hypothetical protein RSD13_01360 [Clostridium sp.]|uniref:hypothetical protein n=1 Tax=Clostridium sp. TaxID=1506 RepID=UPI002FCBD35B